MKKQIGSTLIIVLLFLFLSSMIGISSMRSSALEVKMAKNHQERALAIQAAESGISDAKRWLDSLNSRPDSADDGSTIIWSKGALFQTDDADVSNNLTHRDLDWAGESIEYGALMAGVPELNGRIKQPEYFIEEIDFIIDDESTESTTEGLGNFYYRVTARGYGATGSSIVMLQSIFSKRF